VTKGSILAGIIWRKKAIAERRGEERARAKLEETTLRIVLSDQGGRKAKKRPRPWGAGAV
jgi:hypothetical protein